MNLEYSNLKNYMTAEQSHTQITIKKTMIWKNHMGQFTQTGNLFVAFEVNLRVILHSLFNPSYLLFCNDLAKKCNFV